MTHCFIVTSSWNLPVCVQDHHNYSLLYHFGWMWMCFPEFLCYYTLYVFFFALCILFSYLINCFICWGILNTKILEIVQIAPFPLWAISLCVWKCVSYWKSEQQAKWGLKALTAQCLVRWFMFHSGFRLEVIFTSRFSAISALFLIVSRFHWFN